MSWVILVGRRGNLDEFATPHKIITNRDYIAHPALFRAARPKIINLSGSFSYQSRGYYASLLAGARGHRVIPSVETMIELSERKLYEHALPELEQALNKCRARLGGSFPTRVSIFFGTGPGAAWDRFSRLLFDWFRAPALQVNIRDDGNWASIARIALLAPSRIADEEKARFLENLAAHTNREWRDTRQRTPARYSFAVLMDAREQLPPSSVTSLRHWARISARMGVEVEPIGRRDLARLANYDALFIRETTAITNHTYRFARRAEQEGMPVIDDPLSMIRCTNKVYLNELMAHHGLPVAPTVIIAGPADLEIAADLLSFPMVLKIPDGAFSRGVRKACNMDDLRQLANGWMATSDLLIAQKYMPTEFDWRIGILGGEPLFAVKYMMARKHWQIVDHGRPGKPREGAARALPLAQAPAAVVETATRAARCIGSGFYGVDLKETSEGIAVIEINDNPNLDHGHEDTGEGDVVWERLTRWFIDRLERMGR